MRNLILILALLFSAREAFAQDKRPVDTFQIGKASSSADKSFIFNTNDGAANPKLSVEQASKLMFYDKNVFRVGDGAAGTKEFRFNTTGTPDASLSADFTTEELSYNKDTFNLGDGTDTNKFFNFDIGGSNPGFRYNSSTGQIEQTTDGVSYKKLGAGGGGAAGQNLASEQNIDVDGDSAATGWNAIATAAITTVATTSLNGANALKCDLNAQNDICRTDQLTVPGWLKGKACEIKFLISGGGTSTGVKPQAVDSSNVKLSGWTFKNQDDQTDFLQDHGAEVVQRSIFGLCPSSDTFALELNQTAVASASTWYLDDVHIGQNLGLVQTVNPDKCTGKVDAAGNLVSQVGGCIASITKGGAGFYTLNLTGGYYSVVPAISATPGNNDWTINYDEGSATTSSIPIAAYKTNSVATDVDFSFELTKQGADAQQGVQVYTSVPKVAENENEFSVKITTNTNTASGENVDWVASVTDSATTGKAQVDFQVGLFTVAPNCSCNAANSTGLLCTVNGLTTSEVAVNITDFAGTGTAGTAVLRCSKVTPDYKTPIVQPILTNQVETSLNEGITVQSCMVGTSGGTPFLGTNSGQCETWVDSLVDNGAGDTTVNFKAGIFSKNPNCVTMPRTSTGDANCTQFSTEVSTTDARILCRTASTGGATDFHFYLKCTGVR